ncbi:hypothetical protein HG531_012122 [Fusarium graminearum]|nr:hypothetical protein HG531_012122 [Fusarium graminearum]
MHDTATALTSHLEDVVQAKAVLGHLVHTEALNEDICVGDEGLNEGCFLGLAQINGNGALAGVEGELHDVDVGKMRRVDADDISAEGR